MLELRVTMSSARGPMTIRLPLRYILFFVFLFMISSGSWMSVLIAAVVVVLFFSLMCVYIPLSDSAPPTNLANYVRQRVGATIPQDRPLIAFFASLLPNYRARRPVRPVAAPAPAELQFVEVSRPSSEAGSAVDHEELIAEASSDDGEGHGVGVVDEVDNVVDVETDAGADHVDRDDASSVRVDEGEADER